MNSETALKVIDTYGVGMEGGPEILSDWDIKNTPNAYPPERTGYVFKMSVRVGLQNVNFLYQVDLDSWQRADAGARELLKTIGKLHTRLNILTQLTSMNAPA